jgi:hypothetical protein
MALLVLPVLAAVLVPLGTQAIVQELYTTNAVCRQNSCVNPIFPGLQDLPKLEAQEWRKYNLDNVSSFMQFCKPFVQYDVALPVKNASMRDRVDVVLKEARAGTPVELSDVPTYPNQLRELVVFQERLATKMYFMHLSALGMEPWDHTDPAEESYLPKRHCARSIAKLLCETYFTQAIPTLPVGSPNSYTRPCRSSCEGYVKACDVECCDESVTCVWDGTTPGNISATTPRKTMDVDGKTVLLEMGYPDFQGPSMQCTGV